MTNDKDLEQLREETSTGDRTEMTTVDDAFEEDLLEAIAERNETGAQKSVSIWDGNIAALLDALEENPERVNELVERASERYDISVDEVDRSEIIRVLLISGLAAVDPEVQESWRDAIGEYASQF